MTTKDDILNTNPKADDLVIPQYSLPKILFMFAWPAAWFMFLIWVARPLIFGTPPPGQFMSTWVIYGIATLGNAAELIVALVVLRREGYKLTIRDLRDRARFRWPRGWRKWGLVLVAVAVYAVSILLGPLDEALATVPGFIPPAWWPPMTNPTVEIAAAEDLFPDITLAGNYLFLAVFVVYGIVFNIIGEELYYRSVLLPKMRGVFGKWDWVANGLLFALKHVYLRWDVWASGVFSCLAFALLGGPVGSVSLAMLLHWTGSFLFGLIAGLPLVFGGG
jgi:membrane protease YdiL (CAAX protease family)